MIWGAVLLAVIVSNRDLRRSLWSVVVAVLQPKLIVPLALMLGYVCALLRVGSALGVWRPSLTPDSVAWGIGSGIALFGWSVRVFKPGGSFQRVIRTSISSTMFVEAFVSTFTQGGAERRTALPCRHCRDLRREPWRLGPSRSDTRELARRADRRAGCGRVT